ncbi:MAG: MCP four helix bundle domain-containing protein [Thiotrichales bacterium]|nr:MCP four helix bundle domain-containing protein [Thiotrichales bacterium]
MISIKSRFMMLIGFMLGVIVFLIVAGIGIMKNNNASFETLYADRIVPLRDLKNIADLYAVNIVDTSHKLRNGQLTFEQAKNNIEQAEATIKQKWSGYMATTLTPEEAELANQAQKLMVQADSSLKELFGAVAAQDLDRVTQYTLGDLYKVIDPVSDAVSALVNLQLDVAAEMKAEHERDYETVFTLSVVIGILILLAAVLLSWKILRAVLEPMNELVAVSQQVVQEGDFSRRITIHREDEIGQASVAFNRMIEQVSDALVEANATVDAIAKGNFALRMQGPYVGELQRLKDGVNASADSVAFTMNELGKIMQALEDGRLDAKMDGRVAEGFRHQVERALGSANTIIEQINGVMQAMAQGDFSQRVAAQAAGSFDLLKQNVNQSLDALEAAMQAIQSVMEALRNGDLTRQMDGSYPGALHRIQESLNGSIGNLERIVTQALEASHIVAGASEEVSKGALDLSQRVQQQAAAIEETSATMEEMNSAVQNNTDSATEAAKLSQQVQRKTEHGATVMDKTIEAMHAIESSSQRINEIVSLIDSIAFQTNLLALNAAVEAARAGEHGRGFAVVAGEVRGLAQKAADAAKDIKDLITESSLRVQEGSQLARESGQMLGEIKTAITQVSGMIEQIARASAEQANGVHQVHNAINDIDSATQQNAALVEQTSAASESMAEQAQGLAREMAFFKTQAVLGVRALPGRTKG